ncbi:dTDP-4-keto-6-deoxy-D-glucose epimerase [Streptomyces alfalfae]|nr:dTDP-4-keto-6-deoxy-D-glucose epimerase [Streptomyces fradiae]RXX39481.1 dTDP-4-keto-6-deoxy-D-glucose epimerase [Streptomyces alfalfae]RZN05842.1 dTDP-4-keto-6-deoxy-D-glucose epimerase [Streptomyces alfalfae]
MHRREVRVRPSGIEGLWIERSSVHQDHRGSLHEWFRASRFTEATGRPPAIAQANCTVTRRGSVRGIHFASPGQAKSVACVRGTVLDVVVDIRTGSPTYGRWHAERLDGESPATVHLSEDLGHAFMALSENAVVIYLSSTEYAPGRARAVHPLDPALGIDWPLTPVLSEQDSSAPTLAEARAAGLLPTGTPRTGTPATGTRSSA